MRLRATCFSSLGLALRGLLQAVWASPVVADQTSTRLNVVFILENDPGERNNLVTRHSDLVNELDALIDGFLKNTQAVVPVANKAFDPACYDPQQEGKPKPKKRSAPRSRAAKNS